MLLSEAFGDICMTEQTQEMMGFFEKLCEVALDSGAGDRLTHRRTAPLYKLEESAGSRAGQHFVCAGNRRTPNQGQATLGLEGTDGTKTIKSTFQVAGVTRPLWSVGGVRDEGFRATFDDKKAEVVDMNGRLICTFGRQWVLHLSKLKLKNHNPKRSFHRQVPKP